MVETQNQNDMAQQSQPQQQQPPPQQVKPISQMDKLKLMIIRIGDERREQRDEHLHKLKTQLVSGFVLKDKSNRQLIVDALLTCIRVMPHKVNLYTHLISAISLDDFDFCTEIINAVTESIGVTLTRNGDVFAAKNAMRVLGMLVGQYGVVTCEGFCQFMLQIVEDYSKMGGAGVGTGARTHSADLMLEVLMAALPLTQAKLQKECSIDFGTVVESLKSMFKERERIRAAFAQSSNTQLQPDLLAKTWEATFQSQAKVLMTDRILLSASRNATVDLCKSIANCDNKISSLPQIFLTEFTEQPFQYTLKTMTSKQFQPERLRRYRSPAFPPFQLNSFQDKFEAALATDIAISLIHTFGDSQQMCAQNLVNFYLHEELQESSAELLVTAILCLVLTPGDRPFNHPPAYFAMLLQQIIANSQSNEQLKKLRQLAEEKMALVFGQMEMVTGGSMTGGGRDRFLTFLGTYVSQSFGKDLSVAESFLLTLTASGEQKMHLRKVFDVVCGYIYQKKAKEQLDSQFHQYLPQAPSSSGNEGDHNANGNLEQEPECQIVLDALMARESAERLKETVISSCSAQTFAKSILIHTRKSLDLLKTKVQRYRLIFDHLYQTEAQQKVFLQQICEVVYNVDYQGSEINAERASKVIQKLCQIQVLNNDVCVEYACQLMRDKAEKPSVVDFAKALILQALQRESQIKWQIVTRYIQKPPSSSSQGNQSSALATDKETGDELKGPNGEGELVKQEPTSAGFKANRMAFNKLSSIPLTESDYLNEFEAALHNEKFVFKRMLLLLQSAFNDNMQVVELVKQVETLFVAPEEILGLESGAANNNNNNSNGMEVDQQQQLNAELVEMLGYL